MKNFGKMGRVNYKKEKVLGSIWGKVLYFTKKFFQNIHYWHSALMTVPSDIQNIRKFLSLDSENNAYKVVVQSLTKIRVFSKFSLLSFSFTYRAISSSKISKKSL